MRSACLFVWLTGLLPLGYAWRANRQTSLFHAITWASTAWLAWGIALANAADWPALAATASSYLALSLTGCAAVAVLGARRPGVRAWNLVVVALLAVDALPLAESLLTGQVPPNFLHFGCLAGTLAVGVFNYLPTRLAPAAVALLLGGGLELVAFVAGGRSGQEVHALISAAGMTVAFTPWVGYACMRRSSPLHSEFDRIWLDFRDRYGFLWGQRMREQFNRAAANAGWPIVLRWQGLRLLPAAPPLEPATQRLILATLRALLRRFGPGAEELTPET